MQKKLYRSRTNRVIAGVCGGLAEYLNLDPLVVRLIFVALLLFGVFPAVLLYAVIWAFVPEAPGIEK